MFHTPIVQSRFYLALPVAKFIDCEITGMDTTDLSCVYSCLSASLERRLKPHVSMYVCGDVNKYPHSSPRLIILKDFEMPPYVVVLFGQVFRVIRQLHLTDMISSQCEIEDVRDEVGRG